MSTTNLPQATAVQTAAAATQTIPAAAEAVGYDTETFGPAATLGQNWYGFSFFGSNPNNTGAT